MDLEQLERYKKAPKGEKPKTTTIVLPNDDEDEDEIFNVYGFGPAAAAAMREHKAAEAKEETSAKAKPEESEEVYEDEEDIDEVKQDLWEALNLLTYAVDDLKRVIDHHDAAAYEVLPINMMGEIIQTIAESKKFLDKYPDADTLVTIQED